MYSGICDNYNYHTPSWLSIKVNLSQDPNSVRALQMLSSIVIRSCIELKPLTTASCRIYSSIIHLIIFSILQNCLQTVCKFASNRIVCLTRKLWYPSYDYNQRECKYDSLFGTINQLKDFPRWHWPETPCSPHCSINCVVSMPAHCYCRFQGAQELENDHGPARVRPSSLFGGISVHW